jgi:hypothetical protein
MKLNLFQEAIVNRDFPECNLAQGDIVLLNDYVTDLAGNEGYVLEIYTASGKLAGVATVPVDSIEPLAEGDRLSVRRAISPSDDKQFAPQ